MHVDITVNGETYELQISARRLSNDGCTSVGPLSIDEVEKIWEEIRK